VRVLYLIDSFTEGGAERSLAALAPGLVQAGVELEVACVHVPDDFVSVGSWYRDFGQVSDEEVIRLIP